MRIDPAGSALTLPTREPRIVVGIIYPTASIYVTNKAAGAISNVPGVVVAGCLEDISSTSQEIVPDEGRSTIGTLTFSVVDVAGALTDELRDQLATNDLGVGRRLVRVYTGDTNDFTDGTWRQIELYVVDSVVSYDRGSYKFSCSDLKRELRERIFVKRSTRLVNDITDTATSIEVDSTADFSLVEHTAAFSDAPSSTVGYARLKKTGEVFRFTGVATGPTRFTGVTRGVFNTRAQAIDVDPTADVDRQPEVEQVYYLEMPAPQMAYALMTGNVPDTAIVLPDDYHLGVDTALVDLAMFQQIGTDLYDPADLTAGLVLSFSTTRGLKETDGKRFIEEQLNVPMWAFNPISSDGKIGLRKLTRILSDAAPNAIATTANIVDHGSLDHRVGDVINRVVVNWNHNGDDYTRTDELVNLGSISRHGLGSTRTFEFLGLTVQRHTVQTLKRIFGAISDRYGAPPQSLPLTLSATLNQLEAGDVLRTILPLRDYADTGTLSRSFEIVQKQWNPRTGEVKVTGFASTATDEDQPPGAVVPLVDGWYTSEGTALSSVLTIAANAVTADGNLTTGIYYHAGNLTINAGKTVTVNGTVQLRIRGTLTINGKIDGKGRGEAGLSDTNTVSTTYVPTGGGFVQTIGSTRGSAGLGYAAGTGLYWEQGGQIRSGRPAIARPSLEVIAGALLGLPETCHGTGGIFGGPVLSGPTTAALGSAGGASGAGLIVVARGTPVFGASGTIDLSGLPGGASPGSATLGGRLLYAGGGGGGAPGELYVLLDGTDQVLPDISDTTFDALFGATTQTGNRIHYGGLVHDPEPSPDPPWTGYDSGIGSLDAWRSASLATWVPTETDLGASDDEIVPAPTGLAAAVDGVGVTWTWEPGPAEGSDYTELWVATTNDRTGAVRASARKSSSAYIASDTSVTRYGWVRNYRTGLGYSTWQPTSSTGGVSAAYGGATGAAGVDALTCSITSDNGLVFTQAPGGGSWTPSATTTDVTFTMKRDTTTVATHVVRVTRSSATLSGATQGSPTGDATTFSQVGSGTGALTVSVQHNTSGIVFVAHLQAVQGGSTGSAGADAVSVAITSSNGVQFVQAINGGSWTPSGTTTDITFTFYRAGGSVATRVVRATRSSANLAVTAVSNTGEATSYALVGDGTPAVTITATHTGSGAQGAQAVTTVQGGNNGTNGTNGSNGSNGSNGLDSGNWVYTGAFTATDADTIAWAAGTLKDTSGNSYSISGSNTGNMAAVTYIYWDPGVSTTAFQTTTTATSAVGSGKILIAVAQNVTNGSAFVHAFSGAPGSLLIAGDQIAANSIITSHIGIAPQAFTPTWSGFSTSPTGDFGYVDFGSFVVLWSKTTSVGTSNATTMGISNLPSAIWPSTLRQIPTHVMDNGSGSYAAYVFVDSSGNLSWYRHKTETGSNPQMVAGGGAFTASGSKDWPGGATVVYAK